MLPDVPGRSRAPVFLAASGVQMLIWLKLYTLGYEGIGDLLKAVR